MFAKKHITVYSKDEILFPRKILLCFSRQQIRLKQYNYIKITLSISL